MGMQPNKGDVPVDHPLAKGHGDLPPSAFLLIPGTVEGDPAEQCLAGQDGPRDDGKPSAAGRTGSSPVVGDADVPGKGTSQSGESMPPHYSRNLEERVVILRGHPLALPAACRRGQAAAGLSEELRDVLGCHRLLSLAIGLREQRHSHVPQEVVSWAAQLGRSAPHRNTHHGHGTTHPLVECYCLRSPVARLGARRRPGNRGLRRTPERGRHEHVAAETVGGCLLLGVVSLPYSCGS